jgi:regulatory protein
MGSRNTRRERPPLDDPSLQELALRYVGRFATTRARLIAYLQRKVRERGWAGEREADLDGLADRFVANNYVDDAGFARSKALSLGRRGYGKARLVQALRAAGVGEEDSTEARSIAERQAVEAAISFARRRRLGPFAHVSGDPKARARGLAAMVRAGHAFALSRAIVELEPGDEAAAEELFHLFARLEG